MAKNTSVVLGERYDTFIAQLIQDGRYASASEVLREGLRLVEERERKFEVVRQAAERGDADAQAFIDELR
ncbi:type II toxin-antitoxin system ParD family antitoxin [Corynebacterium mucifaciens]|uniref:Antitoxin ParD1/3/4 n=1 Tax=Corynebacterium mucifaciens TaxID=57171 RepID=A0A7X6LQ25_9CORY|nr:type II toxin-antitoxin system ParD family antitoxin [Corynebacterium mucifaciens]NKY67775.1 type II toxin-antitoxin system ParD family antitoxin [Corynebacterium mucifaciens]